MSKMMNKVLQHRWGRKGQSTAEYIIIVALVAIGSIALITIFGNQLRSLFSASAEQLAGKNTQANDKTGSANGEVDKALNKF